MNCKLSMHAIRLFAIATIIASAAGHPLEAHAQAAQQAPGVSIDVEGDLEVRIEDSVAGARVHHFLHLGPRVLRLQFDDHPPSLQSGTRVRARGRLSGSTLALSARHGDVQVLGLASPSTFGDQRTLVLLVNFQDNLSVPFTTWTADSTIFQDVNAFYVASSYGQTSLSGDVYGWLTLPMNGASCDTNTMASLADKAAASSGINVSAYPHRVYAFPSTSSCGWWGLGTVGGNPSRAWINGVFTTQVVGHEFGHNLGLYHAHSAPCSSAGCDFIEYGDDHDLMGNRAVADFNAFEKERLGWLNYGGSPPIQAVTSGGGSYWLEPLELDGELSKALKLPNSSGGWYYVEVRTQIAVDGSVAPGVLVHSGDSSDPDSSLELDLDPVTDAFDAVLDVGQTFSDEGLQVTTVSADSTGASVNVTFSAPAPPISSVSVALYLSATRNGGTLTAVVTADGAPAPNAAVTFVVRDPTGAVSTISTAANSSGIATTTLHLNGKAPKGTYQVQVTATLGGQTGTGSGSFVN